MITLRKTASIDSSALNRTTFDYTNNCSSAKGNSKQKAANLSPEICIIQAAEALLSETPDISDGKDRVIKTISTAAQHAQLRGLTIDTAVLQTGASLEAWRRIIQLQCEVEHDIRETDRWVLLEGKLISMNAGMPFMVGICQVNYLGCKDLCGLLPLTPIHFVCAYRLNPK